MLCRRRDRIGTTFDTQHTFYVTMISVCLLPIDTVGLQACSVYIQYIPVTVYCAYWYSSRRTGKAATKTVQWADLASVFTDFLSLV